MSNSEFGFTIYELIFFHYNNVTASLNDGTQPLLFCSSLEPALATPFPASVTAFSAPAFPPSLPLHA